MITTQKNVHDDIIKFTREEIEQRILNEFNIPITKKFINNIFKHLNFNHKVVNLQLYQTAMIHTSYLKSNLDEPKITKLIKDIDPINPDLICKCFPLQDTSYERLEFLGDSSIRHTIGSYLFKRYPNEGEGFLTTNRSKIENKYASIFPGEERVVDLFSL